MQAVAFLVHSSRRLLIRKGARIRCLFAGFLATIRSRNGKNPNLKHQRQSYFSLRIGLETLFRPKESCQKNPKTRPSFR